MAVIKSKMADGAQNTVWCSDAGRLDVVREMRERGDTEICDAEIGEIFNSEIEII